MPESCRHPAENHIFDRLLALKSTYVACEKYRFVNLGKLDFFRKIYQSVKSSQQNIDLFSFSPRSCVFAIFPMGVDLVEFVRCICLILIARKIWMLNNFIQPPSEYSQHRPRSCQDQSPHAPQPSSHRSQPDLLGTRTLTKHFQVEPRFDLKSINHISFNTLSTVNIFKHCRDVPASPSPCISIPTHLHDPGLHGHPPQFSLMREYSPPPSPPPLAPSPSRPSPLAIANYLNILKIQREIK